MFKWLINYITSTSQTKYFILNWAAYGIMIIASTVYCYGRLDFVRSYKTSLPSKELRADIKIPRVSSK
jgi:hypothetical protein